jgi:hypothetical protein
MDKSAPDRKFHLDMLNNLGQMSSSPPDLQALQSLKTKTNIVVLNASNDPDETFKKQTKKLHRKMLEVSNKKYHKFSDL